jgi:FtsP/CotA-like multicopper oxidase with cupredoxin domain
MAGAIVIEDDPKAIPPALAAANEREKVMVFQTILYDAKGKAQSIKAFFPDGSSPSPQPTPCVKARPTCRWHGSHRLMTINGQVVPTIHMRPGEVQRWRMVGGAFNELIRLQLEGHDLHEIALDGLYLGRVDTWPYQPDTDPDDPPMSIVLGPGYRSDVLVQAQDEGTYDLIDMGLPPADSLRGVPEDRQVVARVVVEGEPLDMELPTDEEMAPLAPFPGVERRVNADRCRTSATSSTSRSTARPSIRATPGGSPWGRWTSGTSRPWGPRLGSATTHRRRRLTSSTSTSTRSNTCGRDRTGRSSCGRTR